MVMNDLNILNANTLFKIFIQVVSHVFPLLQSYTLNNHFHGIP